MHECERQFQAVLKQSLNTKRCYKEKAEQEAKFIETKKKEKKRGKKKKKTQKLIPASRLLAQSGNIITHHESDGRHRLN